MAITDIQRMVALCREIDEVAHEVYARLSGVPTMEATAEFWAGMSDDESHHVEFWRRVEAHGLAVDAALIFDDPPRVVEELQAALDRARLLLDSTERDISVSQGFVIAYRMEFYLLHPAFELLFRLLGPTIEGPNPAEAYESHIESFIDELTGLDAATPELELLGETISSLWRENKRLSVLATLDPLTEVMNRAGFFALATQFTHLAARTEARVAVLMIDLDEFKAVNDQHGHAFGDKVLVHVARALSSRLRASDIVGRYGGEEFVVLATAIDPGSAHALAETLRTAIEDLLPAGIRQTISIGVAESGIGADPAADLQSLIRYADEALYRAKNEGRNRVVMAR